jgi:rhodanese-related sulfurtransferase
MRNSTSNNIAEISCHELQQRLQRQESLFLLDVRSAEEYRQAHVSNSTLIPLDQLPQRLAELPRRGPIIAVCRSGNRSGMATGLLTQAGFDVTNLKGGMIEWIGQNLPVEYGL